MSTAVSDGFPDRWSPARAPPHCVRGALTVHGTVSGRSTPHLGALSVYRTVGEGVVGKRRPDAGCNGMWFRYRRTFRQRMPSNGTSFRWNRNTWGNGGRIRSATEHGSVTGGRSARGCPLTERRSVGTGTPGVTAGGYDLQRNVVPLQANVPPKDAL